jgi:hypothetical protein
VWSKRRETVRIDIEAGPILPGGFKASHERKELSLRGVIVRIPKEIIAKRFARRSMKNCIAITILLRFYVLLVDVTITY